MERQMSSHFQFKVTINKFLWHIFQCGSAKVNRIFLQFLTNPFFWLTLLYKKQKWQCKILLDFTIVFWTEVLIYYYRKFNFWKGMSKVILNLIVFLYDKVWIGMIRFSFNLVFFERLHKSEWYFLIWFLDH